MNRKKYLLSLQAILMVAVMNVGFTSCGDDDDDVLEKTETINNDIVKSYYRCPNSNHPHMIDLGLPSGTLWACCNVGAKAPEEYGGYYAWGETKTKSKYDQSTYAHVDGTGGFYKNLGRNIAVSIYDTATANWGTPWQMPTRIQFEELKEKTISVWTALNGVKGYKFTGSNGGTIFLPAASCWDLGNVGSYGDYWSSTPYDYEYQATALCFNSYDVYAVCGRYRSRGFSVRPVCMN